MTTREVYNQILRGKTLKGKKGILTRELNKMQSTLDDVREMIKNGSSYYLGEPIFKVENDLDCEIAIVKSMRTELNMSVPTKASRETAADYKPEEETGTEFLFQVDHNKVLKFRFEDRNQAVRYAYFYLQEQQSKRAGDYTVIIDGEYEVTIFEEGHISEGMVGENFRKTREEIKSSVNCTTTGSESRNKFLEQEHLSLGVITLDTGKFKYHSEEIRIEIKKIKHYNVVFINGWQRFKANHDTAEEVFYSLVDSNEIEKYCTPTFKTEHTAPQRPAKKANPRILRGPKKQVELIEVIRGRGINDFEGQKVLYKIMWGKQQMILSKTGLRSILELNKPKPTKVQDKDIEIKYEHITKTNFITTLDLVTDSTLVRAARKAEVGESWRYYDISTGHNWTITRVK